MSKKPMTKFLTIKILFEYITDFVDNGQAKAKVTTACPMSISKGNLVFLAPQCNGRKKQFNKLMVFSGY